MLFLLRRAGSSGKRPAISAWSNVGAARPQNSFCDLDARSSRPAGFATNVALSRFEVVSNAVARKRELREKRDKNQLKEYRRNEKVGLTRTEAELYAKAIYPTPTEQEEWSELAQQVASFTPRASRSSYISAQAISFGREMRNLFNSGKESEAFYFVVEKAQNELRDDYVGINHLFACLVGCNRVKAKTRNYGEKMKYVQLAKKTYRHMFRHFALPDQRMYHQLIRLESLVRNYEGVDSLYEEMISAGIPTSTEIAREIVRAASNAPATPVQETWGERRTLQNIVQLTERKFLEHFTRELCEPDTEVCNSLMFAYARAGSLHRAYELMNAMEARWIQPDAVTFRYFLEAHANAIIAPRIERDRMKKELARLDRLRHRTLASPKLDWQFLKLSLYPASDLSPTDLLNTTLGIHEPDEEVRKFETLRIAEDEEHAFGDTTELDILPLTELSSAEEKEFALAKLDEFLEEYYDVGVDVDDMEESKAMLALAVDEQLDRFEPGAVSARDARLLESLGLETALEVQQEEDEETDEEAAPALSPTAQHLEDSNMAAALASFSDLSILDDQYELESLIRAAEVVHSKVLGLSNASDIVSTAYLNAMLKVYANAFRLNRAMKFIETYEEFNLQHDHVTFRTLMEMFSRAKRFEVVQTLYEKGKGMGIISDDSGLHGTMLRACMYNHQYNEALKVLQRMKKDGLKMLPKDVATLRRVLKSHEKSALTYPKGTKVSKRVVKGLRQALPIDPTERTQFEKDILKRNRMNGVKKKTRKRVVAIKTL